MADLRQVPEKGIKHSTLAQGLAQEPALASYWTFGFVRNPWSRLVSWWAMVQRFKEMADSGVETAQGRFARNHFLRTARTYPDFDTFVLRGSEELERLRTPQVELPARRRPRGGLRGPDRVAPGRPARRRSTHLGLPFPDELPHTNRSPHAHYTTYYSAASRGQGRRAVRGGPRGLRVRVRSGPERDLDSPDAHHRRRLRLPRSHPRRLHGRAGLRGPRRRARPGQARRADRRHGARSTSPACRSCWPARRERPAPLHRRLRGGRRSSATCTSSASGPRSSPRAWAPT